MSSMNSGAESGRSRLDTFIPEYPMARYTSLPPGQADAQQFHRAFTAQNSGANPSTYPSMRSSVSSHQQFIVPHNSENMIVHPFSGRYYQSPHGETLHPDHLNSQRPLQHVLQSQQQVCAVASESSSTMSTADVIIQTLSNLPPELTPQINQLSEIFLNEKRKIKSAKESVINLLTKSYLKATATTLDGDSTNGSTQGTHPPFKFPISANDDFETCILKFQLWIQSLREREASVQIAEGKVREAHTMLTNAKQQFDMDKGRHLHSSSKLSLSPTLVHTSIQTDFDDEHLNRLHTLQQKVDEQFAHQRAQLESDRSAFDLQKSIEEARLRKERAALHQEVEKKALQMFLELKEQDVKVNVKHEAQISALQDENSRLQAVTQKHEHTIAALEKNIAERKFLYSELESRHEAQIKSMQAKYIDEKVKEQQKETERDNEQIIKLKSQLSSQQADMTLMAKETTQLKADVLSLQRRLEDQSMNSVTLASLQPLWDSLHLALQLMHAAMENKNVREVNVVMKPVGPFLVIEELLLLPERKFIPIIERVHEQLFTMNQQITKLEADRCDWLLSSRTNDILSNQLKSETKSILLTRVADLKKDLTTFKTDLQRDLADFIAAAEHAKRLTEMNTKLVLLQLQKKESYQIDATVAEEDGINEPRNEQLVASPSRSPMRSALVYPSPTQSPRFVSRVVPAGSISSVIPIYSIETINHVHQQYSPTRSILVPPIPVHFEEAYHAHRGAGSVVMLKNEFNDPSTGSVTKPECDPFTGNFFQRAGQLIDRNIPTLQLLSKMPCCDNTNERQSVLARKSDASPHARAIIYHNALLADNINTIENYTYSNHKNSDIHIHALPLSPNRDAVVPSMHTLQQLSRYNPYLRDDKSDRSPLPAHSYDTFGRLSYPLLQPSSPTHQSHTQTEPPHDQTIHSVPIRNPTINSSVATHNITHCNDVDKADKAITTDNVQTTSLPVKAKKCLSRVSVTPEEQQIDPSTNERKTVDAVKNNQENDKTNEEEALNLHGGERTDNGSKNVETVESMHPPQSSSKKQTSPQRILQRSNEVLTTTNIHNNSVNISNVLTNETHTDVVQQSREDESGVVSQSGAQVSPLPSPIPTPTKEQELTKIVQQPKLPKALFKKRTALALTNSNTPTSPKSPSTIFKVAIQRGIPHPPERPFSSTGGLLPPPPSLKPPPSLLNDSMFGKWF